MSTHEEQDSKKTGNNSDSFRTMLYIENQKIELYTKTENLIELVKEKLGFELKLQN